MFLGWEIGLQRHYGMVQGYNRVLCGLKGGGRMFRQRRKQV